MSLGTKRWVRCLAGAALVLLSVSCTRYAEPATVPSMELITMTGTVGTPGQGPCLEDRPWICGSGMREGEDLMCVRDTFYSLRCPELE